MVIVLCSWTRNVILAVHILTSGQPDENAGWMSSLQWTIPSGGDGGGGVAMLSLGGGGVVGAGGGTVVLNKMFYWEAPPRDPNLYPFIYHFLQEPLCRLHLF